MGTCKKRIQEFLPSAAPETNLSLSITGANSTDNGNNTGWIFTAPPSPTAGGAFLLNMI